MKILKMMFVKFITLSLLIAFINSANGDILAQKFIPTNEWQTVKADHVLPPRLHIFHDYEKKATKAKLLDEDTKAYAIAVLEVKGLESTLKLSSENDIHALDVIDSKIYQSYKDLAEDLKELYVWVVFDYQVIDELCERFKKLKDKFNRNYEEIATVLVDLEYCVHQVDNAQYFAETYGMKKILTPTFNFEDQKLQMLGLKLMGTAVQSKPDVQFKIYETHGVSALITLLKDKYQPLLNTVLSTITKLIRRFPLAQWYFIRRHGLTIIRHWAENEEVFDDDRFKYQVTELLTDLVANSKELVRDSEGRRDVHAEAIRDYLYTYFMSSGWCRLIKRFLFKAHLSSADVMLQLFFLILASKDRCWVVFNEKHFKHRIQTIVDYYEDLPNRYFKTEEALYAADHVIHLFGNLRNLSAIIYGTSKFDNRADL